MLTLCKEQRLTNFIQGVLMGACVVLTPLLRLMPTSVLWGYFAYLSLESAPWPSCSLCLTPTCTSLLPRLHWIVV